jgi:chromosome segregation ATPase
MTTQRILVGGEADRADALAAELAEVKAENERLKQHAGTPGDQYWCRETLAAEAKLKAKAAELAKVKADQQWTEDQLIQATDRTIDLERETDALAAELAACQARCERLRRVADAAISTRRWLRSLMSGPSPLAFLNEAIETLEPGDLAAPAGEGGVTHDPAHPRR